MLVFLVGLGGEGGVSSQPSEGGGARGFVRRALRPNGQQMHALRYGMPAWWVLVVLVIVAAWRITSNLWGFPAIEQRYAQDIANLVLTGPLYESYAKLIGAPVGHDHISVVLMDDQTLAHLGSPHRPMAWPVKYQVHKLVLDSLLEYGPKAVVVDILFLDPRKDKTLDELLTEVRRYQARGVPLYFIAADGKDVRNEVANSGVHLVDPRILINQGIVRQYPISISQCPKKNGACLSLAVETFRSLCANGKNRDICPRAAPDLDRGRMELIWGTKSDLDNRLTLDTRYRCDQNPTYFKRLWTSFKAPSEIRFNCPYHTVIPVETLLGGQSLGRLVHDRVVFYGVTLQGASDAVPTPVNGMLPGLFTHAMAFDNLISLKGRPFLDSAELFGVKLGKDVIEALAVLPVLLALTALYALYRRRRHGGDTETDSWLVETVVHWLVLLLALLAGLAVMLLLRVSVADWVEVVLMSGELAAAIFLASRLWGYIRYVVGAIPTPHPAE
jgi:CHASE2 domain-containing sensor protein